MELKTKKQLIETTAERIKRQYYRGKGRWPESKTWAPKKVYENLVALDDPTEKKVVEIIGNISWTENKCNECEQDVDITIRLGQEPDYESMTAFICVECLQEALDLVRQHQSREG